MDYKQATAHIQELRGRFDAPFSFGDKQLIAALYAEVLGKVWQPTTCQTCYHDAVIEIYHYLTTHKRMKEKCNYRLRAGYIIHSPLFEGGTIYTNDNLTDAVAAAYLEQFPKAVEMFQQLPSAAETPKDAQQGVKNDGVDNLSKKKRNARKRQISKK